MSSSWNVFILMRGNDKFAIYFFVVIQLPKNFILFCNKMAFCWSWFEINREQNILGTVSR